jgi:hypothetical protein
VHLSRCEVRDHINYCKNDRWRSHRFYRALQRLKSPMRYICEIFGAPHFRVFQHNRHKADVQKANPDVCFRGDSIGVFMRERRRAALRPSLKRPQVCDKILAESCSSLRRRRGKDRGDGKRVIKAVIHRLKIRTGRPQNRLRLGGKLKGSLRVPQQDVSLQFQDPVKAGDEGDAGPGPSRGLAITSPRELPVVATNRVHEAVTK